MRKLILPIILFMGLACSCSGYLDQYSRAAISPDAVTRKDIPAVRNGMYSRVQNAPGERAYMMFDILSGMIQTGTGSPRDLINSTLSPLNSYVQTNWNGLYNALYQVNNMLDITEKYSDTEVARLARGEAYFFRAWIYYNLVTRWGGVPILRENSMEKLPRNSEAEVWAFIEENIEEALPLLGRSSTYYLVSKDAAIALLARTKLAQKKLGEAAALAEQLITSGDYKLDSFEKIFRKTMNTEIIFAFENLTEESSVNLSDLYYTYGHPNKGQGTYRLNAELVKLFSDNDKRKSITIINIAGTDCLNKYPSGQTGTDPLILFRIAEMYLISAEAQGRAAGLSRLNELRRFRGLEDIFPANDEEYLTAILNERRRELIGENFLYYDLVRTGRAVPDLGILDHQVKLPIPGRELQLNTNLTPNPGY
ncbi:SusD family protein [Porphyromonadaceae bacterium KHP3R9]|nr:SusD family protein [Porphyromonadaceae bacterium KHP3R9]